MKRSTLGMMALGVTGAAVGGYGAAIGRDAWRATKKSAGVILVVSVCAASIVLPYLAARDLFRGHPADERTPVLKSLLFMLLGFFSAWIVVGYPTDYSFSSKQMLIITGMVAGSAAVGILSGLLQKPTRMRDFAIADYNERFLAEIGMSETGETEISHIDGEGNPLRLIERTDDTIVFMGVGRRNRRAYIKLSPEGQMLGYTGLISIDEPRYYRASRFSLATEG